MHLLLISLTFGLKQMFYEFWNASWVPMGQGPVLTPRKLRNARDSAEPGPSSPWKVHCVLQATACQAATPQAFRSISKEILKNPRISKRKPNYLSVTPTSGYNYIYYDLYALFVDFSDFRFKIRFL